MKNLIEDFLRFFSSSLQMARMYGSEHPEFNKILGRAYQSLKLILSGRREWVLAVVENELVSGDDIFFDLSKKLVDLVEKLKAKGFERVTFLKGLSEKEFKSFLLFFLLPDEDSVSVDRYFKLKNIENIIIGRLRESGSGRVEASNFSQNSLAAVYPKLISGLSSAFADLTGGRQVNFDNFDLAIDSLIKGADSYYQEFLRLSQIKRKDSITFAHILNVSFLAISFSRYLGFDDSLCREIGFAALFHDLGKIYISNRILKGKKITDKEFEQIKSHSILGAELLLRHIDRVGPLALVVAFEHHLRLDSRGYPSPKFSRRLHLGSMLISICDVYDALGQRRDYKTDYPLERIYKIMMQGKGEQFQADLLDTFFQFMGVWPNGTIVFLSDTRVARVESQNPDDIFSPNVKVFSDEPSERIDLRSCRPGLKIEKSLSPHGEGKKYLSESS